MTRFEMVKCDAKIPMLAQRVGAEPERCGQQLRIDLARSAGWDLGRFGDFCPRHSGRRFAGRGA